jgi:hypothetical protein
VRVKRLFFCGSCGSLLLKRSLAGLAEKNLLMLPVVPVAFFGEAKLTALKAFKLPLGAGGVGTLTIHHKLAR